MTNRTIIGAHLAEAAGLCAVIATEARKLSDGVDRDLALQILEKNRLVFSEIQMAALAMDIDIPDIPV